MTTLLFTLTTFDELISKCQEDADATRFIRENMDTFRRSCNEENE